MGLERFRTNWPDMVGGLYAASADVLGSALRLVGYSRPARSQGGANSGDIEFRVAPVVQAISSYVLPFTFGVIGSLLYVLLQHYTDLRANTLSPKEFPISWLRVILGFVVAACVSLLITSYAGPTPATQSPATGASPPQDLVGSLSLSASGVTFLAGFGAEAVFKLLQTLVERVFQTQKS